MLILSPVHLHAALKQKVSQWASDGFPCEAFTAISEVLDFQRVDTGAGSGSHTFQFLRPPQFDALVAYWYLRLIAKTPRVITLYRDLFPKPTDLLQALGIDTPAMKDVLLDSGGDVGALLDRIRSDDEFVEQHRLESLRETLALDYPSYILALAMGAGKTALIGTIIATEFAMALEYPDGPFIQNALVFAPGLTILGSLRELAALPYAKILPERMHKFFAATTKLIFTRDGDPDIPVIRGDTFNVIVTNTEKIRITKETIRKGDLRGLLSSRKAEEARGELANRRLQAIASLPHLAIFSDEAHHTFGRNMANDLKRVRQTIDYLHRESPNLVAVLNTTGTPYLERQPLLDVVYWYGLSSGIADDILKEVSGNIHGYAFDDQSADDFIAAVVEDFFAKYRDLRMPDGSAAKIAIYFPQIDDLEELRPVIEARLQTIGIGSDIVLANTNRATKAEIDAFDRLNDPRSPHRVILLVNKGTEGWNCPSLFACALARKLKTSNNFVLQAASRCLRQIPGNPHKASIYLSMDNQRTLDRELQETYGESIRDLDRAQSQSRTATIRLRKLKLPPLVIRQIVRRVERAAAKDGPLALERPSIQAEGQLVRRTFDIAPAGRNLLSDSKAAELIATAPETIDTYTAAVKLAAVYRADPWPIKAELARLYPDGEIPQVHLPDLANQIEAHYSNYEVREETIDVALALVKPEGFDKAIGDDGTEIYTAEISYPVTKANLLRAWETMRNQNPGDFGFHYTPYNFDSNPEVDFFEKLLHEVNLKPEQVEDILFTGALTSAGKTDFRVAYKDTDGKWRDYVPDFIIRRKDGRCLIVEIKDQRHKEEVERDLADDGKNAPLSLEGAKALALRRWKDLNPDKLKYEILWVDSAIASDQMLESKKFIETP